MLETIRDYARERSSDDVGQAHARYFADFAEHAAAELASSDQRAALRRLDLDLDNLRTALAWAQAHEPETLARLTVALSRFWTTRGLYTEARRWLDAVIEGSDAASERDVEALLRAGHFARLDGGDRDRAQELFTAALGHAERIGAVHLVARSLMVLGQIELLSGRLDAARARLERALTLHENESGRALTLISLALVDIESGDYAEAVQPLSTAIGQLRANQDDLSLAATLPMLAYAEAREGRRAAARPLWRDGVELAAALEAWETAAWGLIVAAYVEADTQPAAAARWLGAVDRAFAEKGWTWESIEANVRDAAAVDLRERLGDEAWEAEHACGHEQDFTHALNEALAHTLQALVTVDTK
jgi:non-specific serine/threonine protein kinase